MRVPEPRMRPRRSIALLALALALAAGCRPAPVTPAAKTPKPAGVAAGARKPAAFVSTLTGKVKLLADAQSGLVSDHGGGLIGDAGLGMISDHGGGVISNNSGGVISNNSGSYRLAQQAGSLAAFALADAEVSFLDAAGQPLRGADGKPLLALTDASGRYALTGRLPTRNFVARVTLKAGGELRALVVPAAAKGALTADLDTASTIGAAYVLDRLVKGDQAVYDRLPQAEAERLGRELAAFGTYLVAAPSYRADAMAQAAEALAARVPAVETVLNDVRALLLGQAQLGEGRKGTEVALAEPGALTAMPDGSLLIGEAFVGRVRVLAADGTLTTLADAGAGKFGINYLRLNDLARAADGTLWAASSVTGLYRTDAAGQTTRPYGSDQAPDGRPLQPSALALAADGTLYVGEAIGNGDQRAPRVLALREGAAPVTLAIAAGWSGGRVSGLALEADGALLVAFDRGGGGGTVYRWRDGVATTLVDLPADSPADLALAPDGTIYLALARSQRVVALSADGTLRPVAGAGSPVGATDLASPNSLAVGPDGTLWIADASTSQVWALAPGGAWASVAGAGSRVEVGDTTAFAINQPAGVAFGPDGALYIAESGASRVRRFAAGELTAFAGTSAGYAGDGGPAAEAQLLGPSGLSFTADGTLLIAETKGQRIRAVAPDGTIRTLLSGAQGSGGRIEPGVPRLAAGFAIPKPTSVLAGPGGSILLTSTDTCQLLRFVPGADEGTIEALAGRHRPEASAIFSPAGYLGGDEADPAGVLGFPLGAGLDPAGRPHVAEFASCRVMRVEPAPGGGTRLVRVAGRGMADMVAEGARVAGTDETTDPDGVPATRTTLVFPTAVAFGPDGTMFVAEAGTIHVGALGAVGGGKSDDAADTFLQVAIGAYGMPRVAGRIRKVAPDGTISTIAGRGSRYFAADGGDDALVMPISLAIAADGRLAIADLAANKVRILPAGSY